MKRIAITGTTSGIGLEVTKKLNQEGYELILLNRSHEKAESLKSHLELPGNVTSITCDLSRLASVKQATEKLKNEFSRLDGLINNAGGIFPQRLETEESFELTFAVNHLGHFLLTRELMPLLEKGTSPRIINVSSEAHRQAHPDFNDLQLKEHYKAFKAYANAKLFNIYFTQSLAGLTEQNGISATAVHPGFVNTRFGRDFKGGLKVLLTLLRPFMIHQQKGGAPVWKLAEEQPGYIYNGRYFKELKPQEPAPIAYDEENRKNLWEMSEVYISRTIG